MHDILFVSDSISRSIDRAKVISRVFNTKAVSPENLTSADVNKASVIVFDQLLSDKENVFLVKDFLEKGHRVAVFFSPAHHLERTQAEALRGAVPLNRSEKIDASVRKLHDLVLDNSVQHGKTDAINLKAGKIRAVFDDISLAATLGLTPPIEKVDWAADAINTAMNQHGFDELLGAIQLYHSHTSRHSLLVAAVTADFSQRLSQDSTTIELLTSAAIVHDIGKTSIPIAILDKPGKLSPEEMKIVQRHPQDGYAILKKSPAIDQRILKITLEHHEFLDGSGYPNGKTADEIDDEVRLMTICDIFSALIEKRSYKPAMGETQANSVLREMGGKLDQKLVEAFVVKSRPGRGFAQVNGRRA